MNEIGVEKMILNIIGKRIPSVSLCISMYILGVIDFRYESISMLMNSEWNDGS